MNETLIEIAKTLNIPQMILMGSMLWFFYNRLDKKLSDRIDKLDKKFDRLSEKVEDIDRRLCRIEGSLSIHGHCLFSQSKPEKKAE